MLVLGEVLHRECYHPLRRTGLDFLTLRLAVSRDSTPASELEIKPQLWELVI